MISEFKWPGDRERVKAVEAMLVKRTVIAPLTKKPRYVAGVDAAFMEGKVIAAACLFEYPSLEFVEERHTVRTLSFPYIPGYLSFREGPAVIEAVEGLTKRPDLVIFDGQGIAHPRGLGLASFAGVLLDIPSVGCAKSRLIGAFTEPGVKKGAWSPLTYKNKTIGAVVRTRENKKPLFVSPGHRVDIAGAVEIVLGCVKKFRITEPIRCADALSKRIKGSIQSGDDY
ncbi:MAG: deoxyribonuclease V [Thermodesulfobacteriota bacterium]|nr:MAG: deoxyribonuclease V [Thermodesulfobacteriota bacterium]